MSMIISLICVEILSNQTKPIAVKKATNAKTKYTNETIEGERE